MKKTAAFCLAMIMALSVAACGTSENGTSAPSSGNAATAAVSTAEPAGSDAPSEPASAWKPEKSISAEIGYGAGGSTDSALRPLFSVAEGMAGQSIVVNNVAGGSASISFAAAMEQPADGHTLIIGAETPALYDAYDLIDYTYDDVEIIMVVASTDNFVFVSKDSPYQTFKDMVEAELAEPGTVLKVASGNVGANANVSAVIKACTGAEFQSYTSDGSGSTVTTVMGGFADWGLASYSSLKDYIESGDVRLLCAMDSTSKVEGVSPVTDEYPDMGKYLPMNAFYTVTVKKGTDQAAIDYYTDLFTKAFQSEEYQETLKNMGLVPQGLTGDAAREYVDTYRKNAITVLSEVGAITHTPAELGLE